jgi:hypothetical protein
MLNNVKNWILRLGTRLFHRLMHGEQQPLSAGLEPVYQRLVERDLARLGIRDEFYAVGSAANYSLFYVILRAVLEFRPARVIELGAGQTSLLLDRLAASGLLPGDIVTVEHDRHWAQHIAAAVKHPVVRIDLIDRPGGDRICGAYDIAALKIAGPIDLLIIDGPPGGTEALRFSRHGALPLLKHMNRDGFVVVIDDAERPGETALSSRIEEALQAEGITFRRGAVVSSKRQDVFAGGRCLAASYF